MKLVGLTGGIATGKSTVADLLRNKHGIDVIDADRVARDVVEPGSPVLAELVASFGAEILGPDGRLDRPAMRARISRDEAARQKLNGIMHPAIGAAVMAKVQELAARGVPVAVVEAALMIETGSHTRYGEVVVVSCSPETQLSRLVSRDGMTEEAARALIGTQMPLPLKEAKADVVVWNDGTEAELEAAVERLVRSLTAK